jgi:hypothetical protein
LRGSQRLAFTPLGASGAPRGPAARRPRRWSTQLLPWTNVPQSACKRIELSPSSFAALTGEYPANHANLPASTGFFASRRSPVRSRLAPLVASLEIGSFRRVPRPPRRLGVEIGHHDWASNAPSMSHGSFPESQPPSRLIPGEDCAKRPGSRARELASRLNRSHVSINACLKRFRDRMPGPLGDSEAPSRATPPATGQRPAVAGPAEGSQENLRRVRTSTRGLAASWSQR